MKLDAEDVETVASRVVELLREEQLTTSRLVDAAELASVLGRSRDFVYEHADQLGAYRFPGDKSRLMFDVQEAKARMRRQSEKPEATKPTKPRTRRTTSGVELLPIGGGRAA
jgi:hypothetical protein